MRGAAEFNPTAPFLLPTPPQSSPNLGRKLLRPTHTRFLNYYSHSPKLSAPRMLPRSPMFGGAVALATEGVVYAACILCRFHFQPHLNPPQTWRGSSCGQNTHIFRNYYIHPPQNTIAPYTALLTHIWGSCP